MADIPSGALAAVAVSAIALADRIAALARALPAPTATAEEVARTCRRIASVDAPRIRTAADVVAIGAALVTAVQTLARSAAPSDASAGLYAAAADAGITYPASASPVLTKAYAFAVALAVSIQVACLGEAFLAEARTGFGDRQAASQARDRIAAAMDGASDRIAGVLGQEILAAIAAVARQTTAFLVEQATTLQPVVRVDANRSFPSGALAWGLYGDPARAGELAARNRCGTPFFMPPTIEAIAPK